MSNKYATEENRPEHLKNVFLLGKFHPRVRSSIICGFCHSKLHPGYVSDKLIEEHNCIQKNCKYFEKFPDWPYWTNKKKMSNKKKIKKYVKKLEENYLESLKDLAQETIDTLNLPIIVTSVRENKNKTALNIFYVSDNLDNTMQYMSFIQEFSNLIGKEVTLTHARCPDGTLATIYDYLSIKNN